MTQSHSDSMWRASLLYLISLTLYADCITNLNHTEDVKNDTNKGLPQEERQYSGRRPGDPPCAARLAPALEAMRRREDATYSRGVLDLPGISLHQHLLGSKLDMYVTDMKVKGLGWSNLERCRFTRSNASLSTKLVFDEIQARGTITLRDPSSLGLLDWLLESLECNMTMRMRYAPFEINAVGDPRRNPQQRMIPRMSTRFLPESDGRTEFRGCEEPIRHRTGDTDVASQRRMVRTQEMIRQMEMAFLKGFREIMSLYMEKQLRDSMADALMSYLGFTISYG